MSHGCAQESNILDAAIMTECEYEITILALAVTIFLLE